MAQICVNEQACVDIVEMNGAYIANVWIFGTNHTIGPAYDLVALNRDVLSLLDDLRTVASIKESQELELTALQNCLLSYDLEETAY